MVIDDVWTVQAWDAIQSKLPENNMGSRIIVTTRMEMVAKACSPDTIIGHQIHKMEPLKLEDSKKLFLSRVFGSVDADYPEEFEDVMVDILKKCGGLPLAVISIASVLTGYKSVGGKDKWDTVCRSIGSQMESHPTLEGMKHVLTLSYNHLPHELKGCMLFFSIFPEDYVIRKDRLLNRWMAEGLVYRKRGLTMWEVAESYLDELLSRNMIEEGGLSVILGRRKHIGLMTCYSRSWCQSPWRQGLGGQYDAMLYGKIRRLSIHGDVDNVDFTSKRKAASHQGVDDLNMQHARSLSLFHLQGHKLLNQLGSFTLMRVLDLEACEGVTNKHVCYACNLHLLRFLSLRHTKVSIVPRQVENLEHLQMLDLDHTLLVDLPKTVTKLEKLEFIWFTNKDNFWDTLWIIPSGLKKMKALRKLGKVCLGNDLQVAREVGELVQLQALDLSLDSHKTIGEVVLQEFAMSLSKMHSLRWLSIGRRRGGDHGKALNFLHSLPTPPRLLQTLRIRGDMDALPNWIGSLTHLVSFIAMGTTLTDDQLFAVLCKLPSLKTLYVHWEHYIGHDERLVAPSRHKFPVLRDLIFGGYLPQVFQFEEGSMATLETLELHFWSTSAVERSFVGIEHLANLKKVTLEVKKGSSDLNHAMEQLIKAGSERFSRSNQFQVAVKYR